MNARIAILPRSLSIAATVLTTVASMTLVALAQKSVPIRTPPFSPARQAGATLSVSDPKHVNLWEFGGDRFLAR